jgi:hypothetical protein
MQAQKSSKNLIPNAIRYITQISQSRATSDRSAHQITPDKTPSNGTTAATATLFAKLQEP